MTDSESFARLERMGFSREAIELAPTRQNVERLRQDVDAMLLRALADPTLRERLRTDPVSVFVETGLPAGVAEDLDRQLVIDGTSLGEGCNFFDSCLWTCYWTDWFLTAEGR